MGVENLFKIIANAKAVIHERHLSSYKGKTILVDAPIWLHRFGKTAENEWLKNFCVMGCILRSNGINPVFLFDGDNKKELKTKEQAKRREQQERQRARLELGKMFLEEMENLPSGKNPRMSKRMVFELVYARINTVKNKEAFIEKTLLKEFGVDTLDQVEYDQFVPEVERTVEKLEKQTTHIGPEYTQLAMKLFKAMGLPVIRVDGEAESVAAKMINSGLAHAVMTEDSDAFMHGCNTVLTFKNQSYTDERVYEYSLDSVLKALDMDYERFRDLCILLGCDYNDRAHGYPPDGKNYKKPTPIGMTKAICIMQECESLEEAIDCGYITDPEELRIDECRQTINEDVVSELPSLVPDVPNFDEIARLLGDLGSSVDRNYLVSSLMNH